MILLGEYEQGFLKFNNIWAVAFFFYFLNYLFIYYYNFYQQANL